MEDFEKTSMSMATLIVSPQTMGPVARSMKLDVPAKIPTSVKGLNEYASEVVGAIVRHICFNGVKGHGVHLYPSTVRIYAETAMQISFPFHVWTQAPICELKEARSSGRTHSLEAFAQQMEDPIQVELGGWRFQDLCVIILDEMPMHIPVIQLFHSGESQMPPFIAQAAIIRNRALLMSQIGGLFRNAARISEIPILRAPGYELTQFLISLSAFVPPLPKRVNNPEENNEDKCKYYRDTTGQNFGIAPKNPLVRDESAEKDPNCLWPYKGVDTCNFCEAPLWGKYYTHPMFDDPQEIIYCVVCGEKVCNTQVLLEVDSGRTQEDIFAALRDLLAGGLPEFIHYTDIDLRVVEAAIRGIEEVESPIAGVKMYRLGGKQPEFLGVQGKLEKFLFNAAIRGVHQDLPHVRVNLT